MSHFFCFGKMGYLTRSKEAGCCPFCSLRGHSGEEVDLTLFEDRFFSVVLNLFPYNPAHLILFPARHLSDPRHYSPEERERLSFLTNRSLDILDKEYQPAGFNIGYNIGEAAGASIEHIHQHLVPRYCNEVGIPELLGGKRVLVEDPRETHKRLKPLFEKNIEF